MTATSGTNKVLRLALTVSIFFISFFKANAQSASTPSIAVSISDGGGKVVSVQIDKQINNPDGSVSAEISILSQTYVTYGFTISVEHGTADSTLDSAFNVFRKTQRTIPFLGKWTYRLGRIILSPDAHFSINLDKLGFVPGDSQFLLSWDFITAYLLFTGAGPIPQGFDVGQKVLDISETFAGLLGNLNVDTAVIMEKANRGDWEGALELLGDAIAQNPKPFIQFLHDQYNVTASEGSMISLGQYLGRLSQAAGIIHLGTELANLPRQVTVTFSVQAETSTPSSPTTSFGDLSATLVPSTSLNIGQTAVVFVANGTQLDIKSDPSTSAQTIGTVGIGTLVQIEDGPKSVDGYSWWRVVTSSGVEGWLVASVDDVPALVRVDLSVPTVQVTSTAVANVASIPTATNSQPLSDEQQVTQLSLALYAATSKQDVEAMVQLISPKYQADCRQWLTQLFSSLPKFEIGPVQASDITVEMWPQTKADQANGVRRGWNRPFVGLIRQPGGSWVNFDLGGDKYVNRGDRWYINGFGMETESNPGLSIGIGCGNDDYSNQTD